MTMTKLRIAVLLANKDLLQIARDRFGLFFALGFPIAFATAFFFLLSGIGGASGKTPIYLATQEPSATSSLSHQIISDLLATNSPQFEFKQVGYTAGTEAAESGKIPGLIRFPGTFSQQILSGGTSSIHVIEPADASQTAALQQVANGIAERINRTRAVVGAVVLLSQGQPSDQILQRVQQAQTLAAQSTPVTYQIQEVGPAKPVNSASFTIPGYLVMFVFFAAAFTAESVARERENKTLERLTTMGIGRFEVLGGKFLVAVYRGVLQVALLWIVGVVGFHISLGDSPGATLVVSGLVVLVSAAFGVMLASLVNTVRSAAPLAVLASLVAAPLGGCWWPLFVVPPWMQTLAKVTPHGWANEAFNKVMLFGGDFASVTWNLVALCAFTAGFLAIAIWRFRVVED